MRWDNFHDFAVHDSIRFKRSELRCQKALGDAG